MSRNIELSVGEFYHIYNRGTEKRKIFLAKKDYDRFLALLYLCAGDKAVNLREQGTTIQDVIKIEREELIVDICAYCLMPNHFHLLLHEKIPDGISRFMQKLLTAHTMYFNKKYHRNGALFQGKFKATHADSDEYLKYLISYIHLNPIKLIDPNWKENGIGNKKEAKEFLETYQCSSYLDFLNRERAEEVLINRKILPDYFETPKDFESCVTEWLSYKDL
ncbi:MAG: transposase [bacterium]|nr:transposase [bacterium]